METAFGCMPAVGKTPTVCQVTATLCTIVEAEQAPVVVQELTVPTELAAVEAVEVVVDVEAAEAVVVVEAVGAAADVAVNFATTTKYMILLNDTDIK